MKYTLFSTTLIALLAFSGCGSNNSNGGDGDQNNTGAQGGTGDVDGEQKHTVLKFDSITDVRKTYAQAVIECGSDKRLPTFDELKANVSTMTIASGTSLIWTSTLDPEENDNVFTLDYRSTPPVRLSYSKADTLDNDANDYYFTCVKEVQE